MSVTSVRRAVAAAVSDKKVTLEEAEKITHVAGRTKGVSAAEKKEIAKVFSSGTSFAAGSKAHLAATAAAEPGPSAAATKALAQLVNSRGLDLLSTMKDADEEKFSDGLKAGLEKFAEIIGNQDGDSLGWTAGEVKAGKETVVVVTDYDWDKERELVGFFDKNGKELARASIDTKGDRLAMSWEKKSGGRGAPIGSPSPHAADKRLPANFVKDLEAHLDKLRENGEDIGKRLRNDQLPPDVRRRYEHMERTIADGTAAEKFVFKGVTVYALHDFSCVSSAHFYTENGKHLLSIVTN